MREEICEAGGRHVSLDVGSCKQTVGNTQLLLIQYNITAEYEVQICSPSIHFLYLSVSCLQVIKLCT
jgi:hypothetical protein